MSDGEARALRTIHIGVGGRGRWPVDLLTEDTRFRPVALVDVSADALGWARQRAGLPESACFVDAGAALRAVEADALVVCAPTRTHAAFCRLGFGAGKHVLVEKGMTLDWVEAGALVGEADAATSRRWPSASSSSARPPSDGRSSGPSSDGDRDYAPNGSPIRRGHNAPRGPPSDSIARPWNMVGLSLPRGCGAGCRT